MSSKKKRNKNRATAKALHWNRLSKTICPNCGEYGPHWVAMPMTLEDMLSSDTAEEPGFWTCPKEYGADGRRINASGASSHAAAEGTAFLATLLAARKEDVVESNDLIMPAPETGWSAKTLQEILKSINDLVDKFPVDFNKKGPWFIEGQWWTLDRNTWVTEDQPNAWVARRVEAPTSRVMGGIGGFPPEAEEKMADDMVEAGHWVRGPMIKMKNPESTTKHWANSILDAVEDPNAKIPTGFNPFFEITGGFKPGELLALLGRMPSPAYKYKSDLSSYFLRQALEKATPEEAAKLIDQYVKENAPQNDLEFTPQMLAEMRERFDKSLGLEVTPLVIDSIPNLHFNTEKKEDNHGKDE